MARAVDGHRRYHRKSASRSARSPWSANKSDRPIRCTFSQRLILRLAAAIYACRTTASTPSPASPAEQQIHVVCIADTHNHQPALSDGDLLLHAGDLSELGSFEELQAQLDWLNTQPHRHKVVVAGNHDSLLDRAYRSRSQISYPELHVGRTWESLRWGSIKYLQYESTVLDFPNGRSLKIYGAPLTARAGPFSSQHSRYEDVWRNTVPLDTDILLTHGPPHLHLDMTESGSHAGDRFLLRALYRVRPPMVVFGHIHESRGKETLAYDRLQRKWEAVVRREAGWAAVWQMLLIVLLQVLHRVLAPFGHRERPRTSLLINAASVFGHGRRKSTRPGMTVVL